MAQKKFSDRSHRLGSASFEPLEARLLLTASAEDWGWKPIADLSRLPESDLRPLQFAAFDLQDESLVDALETAPLEFTQAEPVELMLPTPDGRWDRFAVVESPIMDAGLAARLPEVTTYRGWSLDEDLATMRLTASPLGVHAQIRSSDGTYYVRRLDADNPESYISYFAKDLPLEPGFKLEEHDAHLLGETLPGLHFEDEPSSFLDAEDPPPKQTTGPDLRTYRLAVAATGEFTQRHGGTVASAQTTIVQAINDVNGMYEDEFSIRFVLVDNTSIVYTDANTDPYTNDTNFTMLSENQANLDSVIGNSNYDIGHVFGTAGGGVAYVGVAGINPWKAQGVSANNLNNSSQTVAHEIGHQFSSHHTWNGINGSCTTDQWDADFSMEPGSGSTILSYGGFCGVDNVQTYRDDYFHSVSFDAIVNHAKNVIPNVGTKTSTGNNPPIVSAGSDFTIPAGTPFHLVGTTVDPDGDAVVSNWEQRDLGTTAKALAASDDGQGPLFRSYPRTPSATRTIPRLMDLLNNSSPAGEQLPSTNREINFRLTGLDGRGGVASDAMAIQVVNTGAAFALTSQNSPISYPGVSQQTITWNVAGTTANGINVANVNLLLSTDGGNSFPIVLAQGVPNDGAQVVVLPGVNTSSARIKVEAVGNIFFDINDADFTIGSSPSLVCSLLEDFDQVTASDLPTGWTGSSTSTNAWETRASGSDSSPNHAFAANVGSIADSRLTSPVINLSDGVSRLQFRNYYDTETTYDGGVLEISINGGVFQDIEAAGGGFAANGYSGVLSTFFGNPLSGRQAWTGNAGGYMLSEVDLPGAAIGQDVQFRWRLGTDNAVSDTGWRIDTIELCGRAADYGDAPAETYPTLLADNGAVHEMGGPLFLGPAIDSESDGQSSTTADGDDSDGNDDDDGISLPPSLNPGTNADVTVSASVDLGLLNAWIDFNANGSWADPGEQIFANQPVNAGDNVLSFAVPADAVLTPQTFARFRLGTQANLSFDGRAVDGEVEDYAIEIVNPTVVQLPTGRANRVVVRKSGNELEVYDLNADNAIFTSALSAVGSLTILGSDSDVDQVLVDYLSGGFFALAGGMTLSGGANQQDEITITGTGATQAIYSVAVSPAGQTQLEVTQQNNSDVVRYDGFEAITFDSMATFEAVSPLSVGANTLSIGSTAPAELGSMTMLQGGSLHSANGIILDLTEVIEGYGVLSTPNEVLKPLTNNGAIRGDSASRPIELSGFVTGQGSLDFVSVSGDFSPGASAAIVAHGSVVYDPSSKTIFEIGGLSPGIGGYDQLTHSGTAALSGILDVQLIDSFEPSPGDGFVILTTAGGITGAYSSESLPTPPLGSGWNVVYESNEVRLELVDLAEVGSVQFGDGTGQRSRIEELQVTFDGQVDIDPDAFSVLKRGAAGGLVTSTFSTQVDGSGNTVATLSFSGSLTRNNGALLDGYYQLTIDGSKVRRAGTQLTLDGDQDGLAGGNFTRGTLETDDFFALYADTNGDGVVGIAEFGQFRATFGKTPEQDGYNELFDYDGLGVGISDFGQFRARFGKAKQPFE